ncbi:Dyp-type peroxidase [Kutzneria buriramensis]|uniref:Deferrochelatase/peroxidase EfeB n=1 Tax=Kutzneria buriramensis TaxID=1045776 RepID=A0A3E0GUR9_9PSEU|nr:Dyp-type peroxidase [Kutzneria buriramensis]REH27679.1 deferrochelatase/peroxidase EfeB [Kutzneria buriramensis]
MSLSRRHFLQGAGAGVAGTALVGGLAAAGARADTGSAPAVPESYPFHGPRQAGVATPPQRFATFAAFDATAADRAGLTAMFKALTDRARFLTAGGTPPDLGVGAPPSDSAVLGPAVPADGLTVTVSVGASLFDSRYGLRKPAGLSAMPTFPDDVLDPAWCHGDVMVQICANNMDTVHHALRDIARHTRDGMQPRYRLDGFGSPPRPAGTPRNLLGFKDGISQPGEDVVWLPDGSCYQVVRFIRMLVEFWDRVSISEQERMFGRRRDSGAPLDGSAETDIPDYTRDPDGKVIPLDSHIRLANPRTPGTARILRRPFNYDRGFQPNGTIDAGLLFCSFQQDIGKQFEAVQNRLKGEPLTDYVTPYGGGYFYVLPGVRDNSDHYASALLA